MYLKRKIHLIIFRPPEVEAAQALANIVAKSIVLASADHFIKSQLAKPVDVIILTVLKALEFKSVLHKSYFKL